MSGDIQVHLICTRCESERTDTYVSLTDDDPRLAELPPSMWAGLAEKVRVSYRLSDNSICHTVGGHMWDES